VQYAQFVEVMAEGVYDQAFDVVGAQGREVQAFQPPDNLQRPAPASFSPDVPG
jgi:hypothetical protein